MVQPSSQEKRDSENEANTHEITFGERDNNYGHDYIVPGSEWIHFSNSLSLLFVGHGSQRVVLKSSLSVYRAYRWMFLL